MQSSEGKTGCSRIIHNRYDRFYYLFSNTILFFERSHYSLVIKISHDISTLHDDSENCLIPGQTIPYLQDLSIINITPRSLLIFYKKGNCSKLSIITGFQPKQILVLHWHAHIKDCCKVHSPPTFPLNIHDALISYAC